MDSSSEVKIYLEIGKKRTFAAALDWPGWCRGGQDEAASIQALHDYGRRYASVLHAAHIDFQPPTQVSEFNIIERISGNATTDFGAPGIIPASDSLPVNPAELRFFKDLMVACWRAFHMAVRRAEGKELRLGPRGGVHWTPRYFVRRAAWHMLDHAWEIEDRIL